MQHAVLLANIKNTH